MKKIYWIMCLYPFMFLFVWAENIVPAEATSVECSQSTAVSQAECEALAAFYSSTGGSNWTQNDSWLTISPSIDVCDWYGITCDTEGIKVLDLRRNNLSGPIPQEIGKLSNLEEIYLSQNQLTGPIPAELGGLDQVRFLYIDRNQLSGTFPKEIVGMTKLSELWFFDNEICVEKEDIDIQAWLSNSWLVEGTGFICGEPRATLGFEAFDFSHQKFTQNVRVFLYREVDYEYLLVDNGITNEEGKYTFEELGYEVNYYLDYLKPSNCGGIASLEEYVHPLSRSLTSDVKVMGLDHEVSYALVHSWSFCEIYLPHIQTFID